MFLEIISEATVLKGKNNLDHLPKLFIYLTYLIYLNNNNKNRC